VIAQPGLFDVDGEGGDVEYGYRAPAVQTATGVTYRQLDYWARTGVVAPSVRAARGSGSQRLYSFSDIVSVKIVKRLLDTGISLQNVRKAIAVLAERDVDSLSDVTLIGDGVSVYEMTDEW
jgi:DNA-binding transcriptional MerR regulator